MFDVPTRPFPFPCTFTRFQAFLRMWANGTVYAFVLQLRYILQYLSPRANFCHILAPTKKTKPTRKA